MSKSQALAEAQKLLDLIRLAAMDGYNEKPICTVDAWVEECKKRVFLLYLAGRRVGAVFRARFAELEAAQLTPLQAELCLIALRQFEEIPADDPLLTKLLSLSQEVLGPGDVA